MSVPDLESATKSSEPIFTLQPSDLSQLIDPKSVTHLAALGGPSGIAVGLATSLSSGLSSSSQARTRVFGANVLPAKPTKSLLGLMWTALQDKVLIILIIAALISLALGLYTTLGTPPKTFQDSNGNTVTEPQVDWVEGLAILIAVAIVTIVGSVNDYQKELQFKKLNTKKEDRQLKLLRSSSEQLVHVSEVQVGDIVLVEPGDIVAVDGVYLSGYGLKCDESSVTGESDLIKKIGFEETVEGGTKADCFLISGSKVVEGNGRYLVTAVGENSFYGKIMMSLRGDTENTPLQTKLNLLAEQIAKLGAAAGAILFTALMIRFFVQLKTDPNRSANEKAQSFIQVLIISVTVVVVAVPEGLPLAVTLALAFATRRMTNINLLVRVLSSCETMANATVVCTDKTGTLTQNKMTVVAGSIGVNLKFADAARLTSESVEDEEEEPDKDSADKPKITISSSAPARLDFTVPQHELSTALTPPLIELLAQSVGLNSTVFEQDGQLIGPKTECALIGLALDQNWPHFRNLRSDADVLQMIPFSSSRKAMAVLIRNGKGYRLLVKGASEVLSRITNDYVVVREQSVSSSSKLETKDFDSYTRANISRTIMCYANQSLRTLALCYKDFETWPGLGDESEELKYDQLVSGGLTLVGILAIEDPLREGVTEAVKSCLEAGVGVKMVTGDNVLTARSIATQCGIYTPGGIIMEGPVFRQLKQREMLEVAPRLQVLARSSPEDKKLLVEHLKMLGEVTAVTGDGTNDGPALKAAHVGFSMGLAGTEVAKEASDIILMDDNFASIVDAIMWGRCVNDSVKKFLQFQLSVNITAVVITFVTSVASSSETSILTAVQLLWVNLIMDTFAALALATDPATRALLKRKPDHRRAPLITVDMWKMIIGQSIFQLVVILILNFAGKQIIGLKGTDEASRIAADDEHKTIVFNTFVFCQIFNQFNARVLDRRLDIFTGLFRNIYFLIIMLIMLAGQVLIVEVGGAAFQVTRIGIRDWGICLIIGFISLPVGVLVKLLPTEPFDRIYNRFFPPTTEIDEGLVVDENDDDKEGWNPAIDQVRDNLATFAQLRGGRVRSSSFVRRSRHSMMKKKGIHTGALMTMVPTLVVTSIGAGWQPYPARRTSLADPGSSDPSRSTAELWIKKVEVHPETPPDDVRKKFSYLVSLMILSAIMAYVWFFSCVSLANDDKVWTKFRKEMWGDRIKKCR
ncbi:hypothetical protein CROQUDRAFT_45541 [Cronartium quercuum f. sp. fusiforme G11]|uniref:Calcium-transporting ATPase n=1 Tax=Cronartium quercuum f. sp. fusiforme G11 TaxID=708437 RepID=A0A9P6NK26_9BASI|nr:hypothetical protein CROQUDRAFT_45541 [Cronartium quercuum f. sp. fusiforme G11]